MSEVPLYMRGCPKNHVLRAGLAPFDWFYPQDFAPVPTGLAGNYIVHTRIVYETCTRVHHKGLVVGTMYDFVEHKHQSCRAKTLLKKT